jgi:glycosyltransferase involved in cell wall biosynthesis
MPRLIAQMVARNEEDRYLLPVLERLSKIASEIIFTDDCSEDGTREIAEEFCHVYEMHEPTFAVDESRLRSIAWKNLTQHAQPGDWVLAIDADEELYGIDYLPTLLDQSRFDVLGISFCHMWNPHSYRVDKAWRPAISSRLFRFHPDGVFNDRRLACGSEPTYVQELIRQRRMEWNTPLVMKHRGYERDEDKLAKYQRYMTLDGGDFHSRAHIESILDPQPTLVPWNL